MNKQELIESIAHLPSDCSGPRPMIDKLTALELIKLLDEPQKVQVPQFVADWYEEHKDDFEGELFRCIDCIPGLYDEEELNDFEEWVVDSGTKPFQTLVNMHQFGYTVEKEKRYEVILCNGQSLKTVYRQGEDRLDFEKVYGDLERFTRKQLEDAGLGWVFDCDGMEVREVQDDSKI